jgi:uncharacterized repeat protein (TIGR01451 family)
MKLLTIAGLAATTALVGGALYFLNPRAPDLGGNIDSKVTPTQGAPKNDQMTAVTPAEGDKRATVNKEDAAVAIETKTESFQSPAVITSKTGPEQGEMPDPPKVVEVANPTPPPPPPPKIANLVTSVTLTSEKRAPSLNESVSFLLTVMNQGPELATGVEVMSKLPAGLAETANNGRASQGVYDRQSGKWAIGNIASGSSVTLSIEGTVLSDMAGKVIMNTASMAKGNELDNDSSGDQLSESVIVEVVREVEKQVQVPGPVVEKVKVVEKRVEVEVEPPLPPIQPIDDRATISNITKQLDQVSQLGTGGFTVMSFEAVEKPEPVANSNSNKSNAVAPTAFAPAQPGFDPRQQGKGQNGQADARMVARTGDAIYGMLDRGFNSDDPQAPIVVTLYDILENGKQGPLYGARAVGKIVYSEYQSAIGFQRLILVDGREIPIDAIAIDEKTARTGVAAQVNRHILQRYGGLLLSGLIEGAGEVGQQLVEQNTVTTINGDTTTITGKGVNYKAAGLAALQPIGQNLSAAAAANFGRPPTFSAKSGMGIGLVFMQPVVLPY